MNTLFSRDFHEVFGKVIEIDMNNDIRLGNNLLDKIPFFSQDFKKEEEDINNIDVSDFYTQLRFNIAETKEILIEKLLIDAKDYWGLYHLYCDVPPYDKLPKLSLYAFCRGLVGKPVLKGEYKKINQDEKTIKKYMKSIEINKNYKKTNGKFEISF